MMRFPAKRGIMRPSMKWILCLAALACAPALAASFPCEKAATRIEAMICKDAQVSTLDEHLAQYYAGATAALADGAACLRDSQRAWLRTVRNKCADAGCLKQAYLARLAELHPLQPGATAIRYFELPKGPGLEWIVPPEQDTAAAPPRPNLPPLVIRGRLLNDLVQGDGFVVQAGDGRKHVLLPSMLVSGANAERLEMLAKDAAARFEVRGHGEADSSGIAHFAASRCSFLYRLP